MHFRKIGIKSGIHFGKIGVRNGYVFETSMARPRPKSGQVPPPGSLPCWKLAPIIVSHLRSMRASPTVFVELHFLLKLNEKIQLNGNSRGCTEQTRQKCCKQA